MRIISCESMNYQDKTSRMFLEDEAKHIIRVVARYSDENIPYDIKITFLNQDYVVKGFYDIYFKSREAEIHQDVTEAQEKEINLILNLFLEKKYKM